jgi:hypothetical protein
MHRTTGRGGSDESNKETKKGVEMWKRAKEIIEEAETREREGKKAKSE